MSKRRSPQYKPLLFTTTVRNPVRIKSLLNILYRYNSQKLTDELCINICGALIKNGLYRPVRRSEIVKNKQQDTTNGTFSNILLTDTEVKEIIENNPQKHKEAGYSHGWPSRFATIFDFAKELGFVYFKPNENIEFSKIGEKLANVLSVTYDKDNIFVNEEHPEFEEQAFLHSMAKYQRKNPFTRVLNNNNPLSLLLGVIKNINEDPTLGDCGISKSELPIIIYWKNNNAEDIFHLIKELRNKYGTAPSWEVITGICRDDIMEGKDIARDDHSIMIDYVDEFIRKMRITGLISIRGRGNFIDINKNEIDKIEYVLKTYSKQTTFSTEREYFDYMAETDEKLISIDSKPLSSKEKNILLDKWLKIYPWVTIKKELKNTSLRKKSNDELLKYLTHPIKLEFLTSLAIKSQFPNLIVKPNYKTDDEGIPTSTAPGAGDMGDIECIEGNKGILVEVTMAGGRTQTMMEIWPISRHLDTFKKKLNKESMCHFIAPSIYTDSHRQIQFLKASENQIIIPHTVEDFIEYIENSETLYTNNIG